MEEHFTNCKYFKHKPERTSQKQGARIRNHKQLWIYSAKFSGPGANKFSIHSSFPSPRLCRPDAIPYLLNNLSIFHVKLDSVHMAEGDHAEGPHYPRAVGIHHLIVDAVTETGKRRDHSVSPWVGTSSGCFSITRLPARHGGPCL